MTSISASSDTKKIVGTVELGRKKTLSDTLTLRFLIHDFERLSSKRGKHIKTSSAECHGSAWYLSIYPGGCERSNKDEVHVSVYVRCANSINARTLIRIGSKERQSKLHKFKPDGSSRGFANFIKRSAVVHPKKGLLMDGALIVELDIQAHLEKEPPAWVPSDDPKDVMVKLMESQKWTDVVFAVGGQRFPAHRCILDVRAPTLCSLSEEAANQDIEISGVEPAIFQSLLRFIYSAELPDMHLLRKEGRALLKAADRFDCKNFKFRLEASLVESVINEKNAADWLLFADSHSCALLKEAALDAIAKDPRAVMKSPGWSLLKESTGRLVTEIMEVQYNSSPRYVGDGVIDNMDVSSLRSQLEGKGLDVDGTREMLVRRLKMG